MMLSKPDSPTLTVLRSKDVLLFHTCRFDLSYFNGSRKRRPCSSFMRTQSEKAKSDCVIALSTRKRKGVGDPEHLSRTFTFGNETVKSTDISAMYSGDRLPLTRKNNSSYAKLSGCSRHFTFRLNRLDAHKSGNAGVKTWRPMHHLL